MATFSWKGSASGSWADGTLWVGGVVPNDPAAEVGIAQPGAYTVTIGEGVGIAVQNLTQAANASLVVAGQLDIGANSTFGPTTVTAAGTLSGTGSIALGGALLDNQRLVESKVNGGFLRVTSGSVTNSGTLAANGTGTLLFLDRVTLTNLAAGTLTGGTYVMSGQLEGGTTATMRLSDAVGSAVITTLAATVRLEFVNSSLVARDAPGGTFVALESSLTTIADGGRLELLGSRGWSTANALGVEGAIRLEGGTINAAGGIAIGAGGTVEGFGGIANAVSVGGVLRASGGVLAPGVLTGTGTIDVAAGAEIRLVAGSYGHAITGSGIVRAMSGTVGLEGPVGAGVVVKAEAGTVLDIAQDFAGTLAFAGAGATIRLQDPAGFSGVLLGFETGVTLDLAGVVATGAVAGATSVDIATGGGTVSIALGGDYRGKAFNVASDGAGGSLVTVANVSYALDGPFWGDGTVTWSFAAANFPGSVASFSGFLDPAVQVAEAQAFRDAFARWAEVSGLRFVEVADAASADAVADIRVGWGNFGSPVGQTIGNAAYSFSNTGKNIIPGAIVRLQDPALTPLVDDGGTLVYQGTVSSLAQVALHEVGHALGLGHASAAVDPAAVMQPTASTGNRNLAVGDIAGVRALYAGVQDVAAPCFARGTHIRTVRGEVAVEMLRPGDRVATQVGGTRVVRWIGHRHVRIAAHPRPWDVRPVRVRAQAFGPGQPERDLWLSPDHAVFAEGLLVPVRYLVNGATIVQEAAEDITYFHVELDDGGGGAVHDVILAEGLAVESYLDTGNRHAFANGGASMMLHPDFGRAGNGPDGCMKFTLGGAALADLRTVLLAEATALGHAITRDPALHLSVAGRALRAERRDGWYAFALPPGAERARLVSRSVVPAWIDCLSDDTRRVGVAVTAISLDGRAVPLDDAGLAEGWHGPEAGWRWTGGAAVLPCGGARRLEVAVAPFQSYWMAVAGTSGRYPAAGAMPVTAASASAFRRATAARR